MTNWVKYLSPRPFKDHAADWVLLPKNLGEYDSIDETTIGDDVYTILSNKAGHGGKGTIIAVVKGTKAIEDFLEGWLVPKMEEFEDMMTMGLPTDQV